MMMMTRSAILQSPRQDDDREVSIRRSNGNGKESQRWTSSSSTTLSSTTTTRTTRRTTRRRRTKTTPIRRPLLIRQSSSSSVSSNFPFVVIIFSIALVLTSPFPVRFVTALDATASIDDGCPPYGCSLKPLDVLLLSQAEMEALRIVRTATTTTTKRPAAEERASHEGDNRDDGINTEKQNALLTLKETGDETKITLTMIGYKGGSIHDQINQDRAMLISPYHIVMVEGDDKNNNNDNDNVPSTSTTTTSSSKSGLSQQRAQIIGVFDGHGDGGELTSQHAMTELPRLLSHKLATIERTAVVDDTVVKTALRETFLEVDRTDPSKGNGGCTATVIFQLGRKLYIANAGDSVSFIGYYHKKKNGTTDGKNNGNNNNNNNNDRTRRPRPVVNVVYKSREDKPDLPDETKRIREAGGYVHIPSDDSDVPRAYHVDEKGRAVYGLAMSRSLGDWYVQGVTAEPIVDVLDVADIVNIAIASHAETCSADNIGEDGWNEQQEKDVPEKDQYCEALGPTDVHIFAVSASDGLMDFFDPDRIGPILAEAFFDSDDNGLHPISAAESLIRSAARGWQQEYHGGYRDDIVLAAFTVLSDDNILSLVSIPPVR